MYQNDIKSNWFFLLQVLILSFSAARAKKLEKKMVQVIQEEDDEDMEEV